MSNEIMDYVMQSPENTNPNVLRGLLENNGVPSSARFEVTFTQNEDETWDADKTYEEINAAYEEGKVIIFQNSTEDQNYMTCIPQKIEIGFIGRATSTNESVDTLYSITLAILNNNTAIGFYGHASL